MNPSPEIQILSAPLEQKPLLRNLLELYQHDFSEFDGAELNEQGLFGYKYLDHYWEEPGRYPFLIKVEGKLAGFALVRNLPDDTHYMCEFFILRKYRRRGTGRRAAQQLFSMFPGKWRVAQEECNLPAMTFWRKVIAEFTAGQFQELPIQVNEAWKGVAQEFYAPGKQEITSRPTNY